MRLAKLFPLLLLCPMAHATVCPTGYAYSKQFVVDFHYVSSTLTNFPVLVSFNGDTTSTTGISSPASMILPDMKSTGSGGKIQSTGNDIVFCDAATGGNLLNYERAQWNSTTGQAEFWVGKTLSSTAYTSFWMFYGKASDTDHSASAAMWSAAGYVMVQHLADGSTLGLTDSTGTYTATNHSATATTGQAGGGAALASASNQYWTMSSAINQTSLTLEAWINPASYTGCSSVFDNTNNIANAGFYLDMGQTGCATNGNMLFGVCSGSTTCASLTFKEISALPAALNTWTFVAGTMTGTSGVSGMHLYINGTEPAVANSANGAGIGTSPNNLVIGQKAVGLNHAFNGKFDEMRIANVAQSAAWETANYYQMVAPFGFVLMVDANTPTSMTSGAYCVPLTVNHLQVPNTDQTNFPLLVRGVYKWMADTANGGFAVTGNSGKDIRFYSNSGCTTALNFQRVYWTNTTGDSSWRVRIPTLSHTTDTTVYVRIGSSSDTSDLSTAWMGSYGYAGVYAGSDPSTLGLADSGSAAFTLGCAASVTAAATPVGGGWYVGSTLSDASTCAAGPSTTGDTMAAHGYPVGSTAGHIRYWFRNTSATSSGGSSNDVVPAAYGKANSTGQRGLQTEYRTCQINGMGETQFSISGPGITALYNCGANTSTPSFQMDLGWHVFDFDQPTNGATYSATALYFDGVKITSPFYWSASGTTVINTADAAVTTGAPQSSINFGRMASHGVGWFNGYVGQFEVTNFSQSADTVSTRMNNELSPGAFYTFGTATPFSGGGSTQPVINVVL